MKLAVKKSINLWARPYVGRRQIFNERKMQEERSEPLNREI